MIFPEQVPIIAFDGNHRIGKGEQIGILRAALETDGYNPVILRGDGSRPGSGFEKNDPYSQYWVDFKKYADRHENLFDAWREGARYLLGEAVVKRQSIQERGVVLFDRSVLSRTQMTLKEGIDPSFLNLYMNKGFEGASDEDIKSLYPDLLLYLSGDSSTMSSRLDPSDPKYGFRKANILGSNKYYDAAFDICESGIVPSRHINGASPIRDAAQDVRRAIINSQELKEKGIKLSD